MSITSNSKQRLKQHNRIVLSVDSGIVHSGPQTAIWPPMAPSQTRPRRVGERGCESKVQYPNYLTMSWKYQVMFNMHIVIIIPCFHTFWLHGALARHMAPPVSISSAPGPTKSIGWPPAGQVQKGGTVLAAALFDTLQEASWLPKHPKDCHDMRLIPIDLVNPYRFSWLPINSWSQIQIGKSL